VPAFPRPEAYLRWGNVRKHETEHSVTPACHGSARFGSSKLDLQFECLATSVFTKLSLPLLPALEMQLEDKLKYSRVQGCGDAPESRCPETSVRSA